ncbi:MAG: hypothetical protein ACREBE_22555, partial [bacterium]
MIRAAAVVAVAVAASPARASAEPAKPVLPKKDLAAQAKSTRHGPPPVPGARPAKLVNLHNFWTKEWLAVEAGSPPPRATVDRFLRDHFT